MTVSKTDLTYPILDATPSGGIPAFNRIEIGGAFRILLYVVAPSLAFGLLTCFCRVLAAANFGLNEDQLMFQDIAKDFTMNEMYPHAAKWDQASPFT